MDHSEYIRITENGRDAVLMIHGIAGTPAHFKDLMPAIPETWSVYNILLDGHGKTVADFGTTSMNRWKAQVRGKLDALLEKHERIVIVAHSMGTLFAIQAAIDFPDRIAGLFLLAVPLQIHVPPDTVAAGLRVALGKAQGHETASAMAAASSIQIGGPLYRYIGWAPRLLELLEEIKRVRTLLPRMRVPCQAFQSRADELVSMEAAKELERNSRIQVTVLENSGHFAYGSADAALLRQRLRKTLTEDK